MSKQTMKGTFFNWVESILALNETTKHDLKGGAIYRWVTLV